jgi:tetratricopeptide (TPR) repeat protein
MSSLAVQEAYPIHLLAQNLNNHGAHYIEIGHFERAIASLIKAFQLWEQVATDEEDAYTSCSLDECILQVRQDSPLKSSTSIDFEVAEDRFIYRRPIYSLPKSIVAGHAARPGAILSFIITFNLAIAHHLSAIQNKACRRRLDKALQLYEIAYQFQSKKNSNSPRATMIITNNVGEIHRIVENHYKHAICMQHLLSTIMTSFVDFSNPARSTELEGFFRNTSQLILHNNCAGAA